MSHRDASLAIAMPRDARFGSTPDARAVCTGTVRRLRSPLDLSKSGVDLRDLFATPAFIAVPRFLVSGRLSFGTVDNRKRMPIDDLRRYAVARSLFPRTSLPNALEALGFVQADPIRAPARAQDLTLRHRVTDYRAGDLERQYAELPIEEVVFVNYGFVTRGVYALMHPRTGMAPWSRTGVGRARANAILQFV